MSKEMNDGFTESMMICVMKSLSLCTCLSALAHWRGYLFWAWLGDIGVLWDIIFHLGVRGLYAIPWDNLEFYTSMSNTFHIYTISPTTTPLLWWDSEDFASVQTVSISTHENLTRKQGISKVGIEFDCKTIIRVWMVLHVVLWFCIGWW